MDREEGRSLSAEITKELIKRAVKKKIWAWVIGLIGGSGIGTIILVVVILVVVMGGLLAAIVSLTPSLEIPKDSPVVSTIGAKEIPAQYLPIYQEAGAKYGVPWNVLAGVHRVETVFSTNVATSSAGAVGHMQFMPQTWVGWNYSSSTNIPTSILTNPKMIKKYGGYGIDANGDGKADPYNIKDAIFSAANYLSKTGGKPFNAQKALWSYNHSTQYYNDVMGFAKSYAEGYTPVSTSTGDASSSRTALPFQEIAKEWIDTIQWQNPMKKNKVTTGLPPELKTQVDNLSIRIPPGMLYVLSLTSEAQNKDKVARKYAAYLTPTNLKVGVFQKKITIEVQGAKNGGGGKTETTEDLLLITSVQIYKGIYKYKIGYDTDVKRKESSDGSVRITTIVTPVIADIDFDENDELVDNALKAAHIRGKTGKKDFYQLVRMVDPSFADDAAVLPGEKVIIPESPGGGNYGNGQLQWIVPGFYRITSPFGYRTHPVTGEKEKLHKGADIGAPVGTPTVAADDGVVESVVHNNAYAGNFILIDHGNGLKTRYLHLSETLVSVGQSVKRGQLIAKSGATGRVKGAHMHIEVLVNGQAVNPLPYFSTKGGTGDEQ